MLTIRLCRRGAQRLPALCSAHQLYVALSSAERSSLRRVLFLFRPPTRRLLRLLVAGVLTIAVYVSARAWALCAPAARALPPCPDWLPEPGALTLFPLPQTITAFCPTCLWARTLSRCAFPPPPPPSLACRPARLDPPPSRRHAAADGCGHRPAAAGGGGHLRAEQPAGQGHGALECGLCGA